MANNSIKGRFRDLFQEVQENLTEESKTKLKELSKLNQKALHDYRNNLLKVLEDKYLKIINDLAIEFNISVEEIEYRMIGNLWDNYMIAIEKLNEPIRKFLSEEEINKRYEEIMSPMLNQSEEERTYWNELRLAINGYDEDDFTEDYDYNELESEDNDETISEEESRLDSLVFEIEKKLQDKLTFAIKDVEKKLNISGQVIDFFLEIYDVSKPMYFI